MGFTVHRTWTQTLTGCNCNSSSTPVECVFSNGSNGSARRGLGWL